MKRPFLIVTCSIIAATGCVVNPDADKALRDEGASKDSVAAAEPGVQPLMRDTGQHAMPVAPVAPGDMPVVNPADSGAVVPK